MKKNKVLVLAFSALVTVFTVIGSLTMNNTQALEKAVDDSQYTVAGVSPQGTTINVFDYWLDSQGAQDNKNPENYMNLGINNGHALKFGKNMRGDLETVPKEAMNLYTQSYKPYEGIVSRKLGSDGYPILNETDEHGKKSLDYLFNAEETEGKAAYMDVEGLLRVDDGYYYYNSQENFAQFNKETKDFTLYKTWGVKHKGKSPDGQFFPFNLGTQVFNESDNLTQKDIQSENPIINHYFGLSMSTRFVQQYGGHTDEDMQKEVTYNFSGDDDVWIFIDNVLVGDLGGIHDKASIEINFANGTVVIYKDGNNNNKYDSQEETFKTTTLGTLLEGTGIALDESETTLADDTYHTLNFFYLERGNSDSNMSLKYNLVTMPETDIVKVDAEGNPVSGITFQLIPADKDYNALPDKKFYTATTENDGKVVFLDNTNGNELPLQLETMKDISDYWILRELNNTTYRTSKDTHLYFTGNSDKGYLLLSDNIWDTGTYAQPKVLSSAGNNLTIEGNDQKVNASDGQIYAVPQKKIDGEWISLVGSNLKGWNTESDIETAIKKNGYKFLLGSSGAYECIIDEIPGDVTQYEYMEGKIYRMAYYYVGNDNEVKGRITDGIERKFSARLYVSNISNALVVQKQDCNGNPIVGEAEFTLYSENDVTMDEQENVTVNPGAEGTTKTTRNLTSPLKIQSAVVFDNLDKGTYYLAETKAPEGYRQNTTLTKVIVDDQGVYADAGSADDGVAVSRGVGRILKSVSQFATSDAISSTLHDIIATLQTSTDGSSWIETNPKQEKHLQYDDAGTVLEYGPENKDEDPFFTVEEGWSNVKITQCLNNNMDNKENLSNKDLTSLFTGSIVVAYQDPKEVSLEGTKILDGEDWPEDSSFTFELKTNDEDTIQAIKDGDVLLEKEDEETNIDVPEGEKEVLVDSCTVDNKEYEDGKEVGFNFNNLILKKYGTYKFTVNEKAETLESIQYSKAQYDVEINYQVDGVQITKTQTRDDEGNVLTKPKENIIFTNKFVEEGVLEDKDSLTVKKVLNGRDWKEGDSFTFTLEACDDATKEAVENLDVILPENAKGITITDKSNPKKESFGDVRFKKEGQYIFTIKETKGNIKGITYDTSVKYVHVYVTNNNNKLEVSSSVKKGENVYSEEGDLTFTNTYEFTPTTSTDLNIPLEVSKKIEGRNFQKGDTFTFTIAAARATPNAPLPTDKDGNKQTEVTITPTSGNETSFNFEAIKFTEPGEYRYIIRESIPDNELPGVDYDATIYRLNIVIKDNGDGTLGLASVDEISQTQGNLEYTSNPYIQKYENGNLVDADKIEFKNKYEAKSKSINLYGTKILKVSNSDRILADDDFTFKLEKLGSNTDGSNTFTPDSSQPMPTSDTAANIANENIHFGPIEFTKEMIGKTFGYKITEVLPSGVTKDDSTLNGVTYDTSEKIVKVTVEDDGKGNVIAKVSPDDGIDGKPNNFTFTNTYEPTPITANIQIQKTLDNRNWLKDETYTFTLKSINDAPMPEENSITLHKPETGNVQNGSFDEITYEKAGVYAYEITEKVPLDTDKLGGIIYDKHISKVTVTVTEDQSTGTLSTQVSYDNSKAVTDSDKGQSNVAAFTNTYNAEFDESTIVNLNGTKNLKVNGNSDYKLKENEFLFKVQPLNNAPYGDATLEKGKDYYLVGNTADDKAEDGVFSGTIYHLLNNVRYSMSDMSGQTSKKFNYLISEVSNNQTGVSYDDSVYKVTVKVTDDGKGNLKAFEPIIVKGKMEQDDFVEDEDQSDVNDVVFNNSYTPTQGSVVPVTLTKTLSGKDLKEGEFTFKIQLTEGDKEGVNLPESTQVSNDADGKVQFGNIVFTKAGEYEVTMQEVIPEDATKNEDGTYTFNGVTYDTHKVVVTYTVTDKNGQLQVEPKVKGETEFKNKYSSSGSTENVDLVVTKTLTGRDWKENDEFTFTLKAYDENTKNAIENGWIVLPENAAGLKISYDNNTKQGQFGDIQVTKAGSYIFVVEEEKPEDSLQGVSYDTSKKYVILDAEDQGNGKIKITTSIKNEPSTDSENTDLSFTNTYTPTSFEDVPEKFSFSKVLTGREWTNEDSFSFTLEGLDNAPMPEGSDGQFKTIDVTKENAENFNFGAITYTKPGSYKYKVSENKPDTTNGIQYDSHVSEITVVVEDTGNGKLSAVAQTKTNTTFTNTYTTTEVDYDVSPGLQIVKNMTGQAIEENDFTFTMSGTDKDSIARLNDGKPLTVSTKGGALIGNTSTEVIRVTTGLLFTKEDAGKTYTYTVKENIPEDAVDHVLNGVTYDAKEYTVTFKVTEDGKGMLSVETSVDGVSQGITQGNVSENALPAQLVFNNSYQAEPTTVGAEAEASIQAHKVLNNASISNYDGAFHFNVTGTNNAVVSTGTNDGNGLITFSDIHYTTSNLNDAISESGSAEVGKASVTRTETEDVYTFKYTVSETGTLPEGVSIVKGSFNVTVTVTDDHLGHLSAVVTYDSGNALEFVNTYGYGQTTELYLKGNKVIAAKDGLMPPTLTGGEYQFTITGSQGAPLPETTTVTNQGSNIEFGPITYTMENVFGDSVNTDENTEDLQSTKRTKVFTYTITESGSLPGVINDPTIKTVEVTVTDRGDGTIEAAVTKVSEGAVPGNDFTFVNTYNVTPTSPTSPSDFAVTIKKELEGQNLYSGEFTFQIKDGNGNVISEAQNDENGNVIFPGITFDTVGVYKYTISELNTGVDGFSYDTTIYDTVANVTDNGDGTLNVEWTVTKNQTVIDSITFKNSYKPISNANIQIAGIKKLEGQSLKDGQFTFELRDDEGNVVETATNDENGKINFKEISFDKAGTYHYTLREVYDKQTNIKYDESVYEIVVQVEDDQVGHLLVTKCDITKEGKESTIVFTNEYQENEQPGKEPNKPSENNGGSDTSENTNAGIFISLLGSAISLMGILFIWRKRSI